MNRKELYIAFILGLFLISCQKEVEVDIPPTDPEFVVEGKIESNTPPMVILTQTQGYFDPTDANSLFGSFVHNATMNMSDGTNVYPLSELCTSSLPDSLLDDVSQLTGIPVESLQYFDYCVYTSFDPLAMGVDGKKYSLEIDVDGHSITAQTSIPYAVALDSSWFEPLPSLDSLGFMWATLQDPDTAGNSYRWYAQRINQYLYNFPGPDGQVQGQQKDAFPIAPFGSVFDDKFFNGLSFDLQYNRGEVGNLEGPDDEGPEEGYFKSGDTVVLKFTSIDHATFLYYRALENQAATNGSPFAAPGNLPSNVEGGIGIWGGHGIFRDTVICQ